MSSAPTDDAHKMSQVGVEKKQHAAALERQNTSSTIGSRRLSRKTTSYERTLARASSRVDAFDAANFPTTVDIENPEVDPAAYITKTESGFIQEKDSDRKLVTFKENDPENPKEWPKWKKWYITITVAWTCLIVAYGSAMVTGDFEGPMATFNVSLEVSILQISLFVVGFGVGPIVFAPLSEIVGRRPVYVVTLAIAVLFILPCMLAQNIGTLIVGRMIDGIAFAAPMTLVGGSLADVWKAEERGVAMAFFSAAPFSGPALGPLCGGFIGQQLGRGNVKGWNVGWRWIYYIYLIFAFFTWVLITIMPETHAPTILKKRAKKLRKETGDKSYVTAEEIAPLPLKEIAKISVTRPFILLTEPIIFFVTIYMSVLYGLIYMFFFAFPVIYKENRHWNEGQTGMAFLGLLAGTITSGLIAPFVNKEYLKMAKKYHDKNEYPPPEIRLIPMMIGCWLIPAGLFTFAWTSYPTIHWIGPIVAAFPVGLGFTLLYNAANNYIVDSYQHYAASGLAAKTFLRSMWGAGVCMFTVQMYHKLNPRWASSLLGFIAIACCAIPYVFWFFGDRIRARSKYAFTPEDQEVEEEQFPPQKEKDVESL